MGYKVLFFDSWKGGIHHFLRLVPAFSAKGITSRLIHLGSWGNEDVIIKEEQIDDLSVRDISFYNGKAFIDIIRDEKPDLVLFLSTHTFAHRAFIRYCHYLHIPTINLYHGYVRVQDVDNDKGPYKVNFWAYLFFALKRTPKLLQKTIPTYVRSLRKTKARKDEWAAFYNNLLEVITKPSGLRVADDARTTRCLIYAKGDTRHAITTYGFEDTEVIEVGNPDLVDFDFHIDLLNCTKLNELSGKDNVMYVDTALTATGLIVKSKAEYLRHIIETNESLHKQGKKLLFRPHPETSRLLGIDKLKEYGIAIIDKADFIDTLKECCAVIIEPSTLSLIPALMGIPIFLAQYGRVKDLNYGEVLMSYPVATILDDIDLFSKYLSDVQERNMSKAVGEWAQTNSGPLPAEDMPKRVADAVINLINKRQ